MCKIVQLELLQLALEYVEVMDTLADKLPGSEEFKLKPQLKRAAVNVALNTAEATTGKTEDEQGHYLRLALDSLTQTVIYQQQIHQMGYPAQAALLRKAHRQSKILCGKLRDFYTRR